MKIKIEPSRLREMIEVGLIGGKLDSAVALLSPNALSFQDLSIGQMGVYAVYAKDFFPKDSFECGDEKVSLTKYLQESLSKGFKGDEQVTLHTDNNHLFVTGARDKFEDLLSTVDIPQFPILMKMTQYGFLPDTEKTKPKITAKFSIDDLSFISAEKYLFNCDGQNLEVRVEFTDTSAHTKTLKPTNVVGMEKMSAAFVGDFFSAMIRCLTGEVWLNLSEDYLIISKKEKTYSITFLLGSSEI